MKKSSIFLTIFFCYVIIREKFYIFAIYKWEIKERKMELYALLSGSQPGIDIFGFKITAYALIIVSGMIAAFFVISLLFKRRNMSGDLFLTFFCFKSKQVGF